MAIRAWTEKEDDLKRPKAPVSRRAGDRIDDDRPDAGRQDGSPTSNLSQLRGLSLKFKTSIPLLTEWRHESGRPDALQSGFVESERGDYFNSPSYTSQRPNLSRTGIAIQRSPAEGGTTTTTPPAETAQATPTTATAPPEETQTPTPGLIVDDSAAELLPGQIKKSVFLAQLRAAVLDTAEAALSNTIWSALGCPWIDYWFGYYSRRDSQSIERAIQRYTGAAGVGSAADYVPIICSRVRYAIEAWRTTGEVKGVPEGVPAGMPGTAAAEGGPSATPGLVSFKPRQGNAGVPADPAAVQARLDTGSPLDSSIRSRMEAIYSQDFSGVRVHTDAKARSLSEDLNARAFTVGRDIAFATGEYKPGTLIGDALIAHELAHVVQQGGGTTSGTMQEGETKTGSLEEEADTSALGAMVSLWGNVKTGFANIARNTMPSLRSGLRLQRCQASEAYKSGTGGEYHGVGGMLHAYVYEPLQEDYSRWMAWGESLPNRWGEDVPVLGHVGGAVVGCIPWFVGGVMKIVVAVPQFITPKTQEEHFLTVATAGTGTPAVRIGGGLKYGWWWLRNFFKKNPKVEKQVITLGKEAAEETFERAGQRAPTTMKMIPAKQAAAKTEARVIPDIVGTTSKVAQNLVEKGFSPDAINSMRLAGITVTNKQLSSAGPSTVKFINTFYRSSGFDQVIHAWAAGGRQQEGARFVMKYCAEKLSGKSVVFEWPAGIRKTASGETWARYVDVVVKGGNKVHPGDTIYMEFKSWTTTTLARSTGKIKYQLIRDRALFDPGTIRWVFDSSKVSKDKVLDAFCKIIKEDAYLAKVWGGTDKEIREAVSLLVEFF